METVVASDLPRAALAASHQVRESFAYQTRPPSLYNWVCRDAELAMWFLRQTVREVVKCPPETIRTLLNVYLLGGKYLMLETGELILESISDAYDAPRWYCPISSWEGHHHLPPVTELSLRMAHGPLVHIAKEGVANYGHLLVEVLPKFANLKKIMRGPVQIVLPQEAEPVMGIVEIVARAFGFFPTFHLVPDASIVRLKEVAWVGPVSSYPTQASEALLHFRHAMLDRVKPTRADRRLFVTRNGSLKRPVINIHEIEDTARAHGFEVVEPSKLPFMEQVNIFSEASHIVGPLGAGLTNVMFSPHTARVGVLDPSLYDLFYWNLCQLLQQEYHLFFTKEMRRFDMQNLSCPYSVDVQQFDSFLKTFLLSAS